MLKTSRINILRLLVTNIYSKFPFYIVVVVKWRPAGGMGGLLVDPSTVVCPAPRKGSHAADVPHLCKRLPYVGHSYPTLHSGLGS